METNCIIFYPILLMVNAISVRRSNVDLTNEMVESKLTSSSGQICRFTDVPRSVCNYREIQNALTFHYLPSSVGLAQTKVATTI